MSNPIEKARDIIAILKPIKEHRPDYVLALITGFKALDKQHKAALAVVEAAQNHKCFGRTDGYNYGCPTCSALRAYKAKD